MIPTLKVDQESWLCINWFTRKFKICVLQILDLFKSLIQPKLHLLNFGNNTSSYASKGTCCYCCCCCCVKTHIYYKISKTQQEKLLHTSFIDILEMNLDNLKLPSSFIRIHMRISNKEIKQEIFSNNFTRQYLLLLRQSLELTRYCIHD